MAFTTIQFKATNVTLEGKLQDLIEHKLTTLEKYLGQETDVLCSVELEKVAPRQHGLIYRLEVNITKAGHLFRAEATEDSFEKAIDKVKAELDEEMRRAVEKKETMIKRGGRMIKDMIRFGR